MAKDSGSIFRYSLPLLIVAMFMKIGMKRMAGPEPAACTVLRNVLLSTKKVNEWKLEKDPSIPGVLPDIPFEVIQSCGWRSWKMPYAYTFTFLEDPIPADELVKMFLERNKMVQYRESVPGITNHFGIASSNKAIPKDGPFREAWEFISKGKASLYFDNSWSMKEYENILSKDIVGLMTKGIKFGTMFMCNLKKHTRTASLHAASTKSLAMQMSSSKTWELIAPNAAKKHLYLLSKKALNVVDVITLNETDVFANIPHYTVVSKAGQGLYFPEFWYHIVYSDKGINIMTNWRQTNDPISSFKNSPYGTFKSLKLALMSFIVSQAPKTLVRKVQASRAPFRKNAEQDYYRELIYKAHNE